MLPSQVVIPRLTGFPVGADTMNAYLPLSVASDAIPVIRTEENALLVESVTEVAVRVTIPPAVVGTDDGAV